MGFSEIIWGLLPWCLLGVYCVSVIGLLLQVGYVVYKKLFRGRGVLPDGRWLALAFLCGYLCIVLGLTNFSRAVSAVKAVNLIPFFAYFDAFAKGSLRAWQLIVFNILMFIPLGVLVPLAFPKLDSLKAALICGFAFSLLIETLQLIGSTGIFELDDLFHNTLGAGLGYMGFCLLTGRRWTKPKKRGHKSASRTPGQKRKRRERTLTSTQPTVQRQSN